VDNNILQYAKLIDTNITIYYINRVRLNWSSRAVLTSSFTIFYQWWWWRWWFFRRRVIMIDWLCILCSSRDPRWEFRRTHDCASFERRRHEPQKTDGYGTYKHNILYFLGMSYIVLHLRFRFRVAFPFARKPHIVQHTTCPEMGTWHIYLLRNQICTTYS